MSDTTTTTVSIGPMWILAIVFIVLKLTEVITWSWLWVLAPLWGPIAFFGLIAIISFVIVVLTER